MRVNLNIDGAPITSRSHTHPSHSQASRLLTSSLSLGVPVPCTMQCMRGMQIPLRQFNQPFITPISIYSFCLQLSLLRFIINNINLGSSYFHFRRAAFSCLLKSKCGNILAKASALRVNLNLDGAPIASNSHTHPSHSQTSRLLTSSLSLGVPVPRPTQCMGDA